jgi:hypothetical protein
LKASVQVCHSCAFIFVARRRHDSYLYILMSIYVCTRH